MKLEIIAVYENLDGYILEMEKGNADCEMLWYKYAVEPYWEKISQWAPFDMSDRKPKPIKDIEKLKNQIKLLKKIDLNELERKLLQVVEALPNYDDDPITIAIYPLNDENAVVKEKQNGVLGVNVFGNILINVNPFSTGYVDWIPYVFAHEYHHTVWGNYWHVIHGGLTGKFIESILIDGQADFFAKGFNEALNPTWISQISRQQEEELWNKYYSKLLNETDVDYVKYMFGDTDAGIPWCAGYFFGYKIIDCFKKRYPKISVKDMIEMNSEEIFTMSNYGIELCN
ncbi:hypothetical protein JK636_00090 [Clostridium sp. YIM B02515]|uniref:DUF2268 domain-containing protein n=1 Tax=Clostridium rhizosphaerae TaxID=2803861 RepID=A0ABS1T4A0_9CLOT|nr:DUF2268 domain-containing putative Zn-dependent protease [Clostridium rhizosphaerae]MBL4934150.1 hypothetical protein [Clostridium rhizosphaerae]